MLRRHRHRRPIDTGSDLGLGAASPAPLPARFPRSPMPDSRGTPVRALEPTDGSQLPARSPYSWTLVTDTVLAYGLEGRHAVLHARVFEPDPAPGPVAAALAGAGARALGAEPVVLLGQLGDHVGPSIINSIEEAAAAAQARFYPGGELMRVVLLYPRAPWYGLDAPAVPLTLREVGFTTRTRHSGWRRWADRRRGHRLAEHGSWEPAVTTVSPDGVTRHSLSTPAPAPDPWTFHDPHFGRDLTVEMPADQCSAVIGNEPGAPRDALRFIHPTNVRVPALLGETRLDAWPEELYTAALVAGPEAGDLAAARRAAVRRRAAEEACFIDAVTEPPPGSYLEFGAAHRPGAGAAINDGTADDGDHEQPGTSR